MGKSWFLRGKEGIKESRIADEAQQRKFEKRGIWRFHQKNNETAKIILLDTPDFFLYEHSLYPITGKMDTETCLKDFDTCPLCAAGYDPALVLVCTIIDTRKFEDKEGKVHKNQKRLLALKGKARQAMLRRIAERNNNLKFAVLQISRGSSINECGTGEDIQFLSYLKLEQMRKLCPKGEKFDEWIKPFNYEKLLAPSSREALARLVGAPDPVGSSSSDSAVDGDDDTPAAIGDVDIDSLID